MHPEMKTNINIKYRNFYEEGFENDSEVFEKKDYIDWKYFIYYYKDTPVAFTEFKVFDNKHVLSGQFAWDYENPKLGLGTYATLYEIDWSYKNKYKNYYLSYGYETTSKYKSKYKGFEFWNGKEWVNNKSMYNKLCDNDSSIESIKDLNKYQREYFKLNGKKVMFYIIKKYYIKKPPKIYVETINKGYKDCNIDLKINYKF